MAKQVPRLVVFVLLPPALVFGVVLLAPQLAAPIKDFGSALTGYATLIVAAFAIIKLPSEFRDSRRRRAHEKAAEVAGQAIVAARQLCGQMTWLTLPKIGVVPPKEEDETPFELLDSEFSGRWLTIKTEREAFAQAQLLAEAYLPTDAVDALQAINAHLVGVRCVHIELTLQVLNNAGSLPDGALEAWSAEMQAAADKTAELGRAAVQCLRQYTIGDTDWLM
jgi:hypothetical protein